jgi:hypothetical protein
MLRIACYSPTDNDRCDSDYYRLDRSILAMTGLACSLRIDWPHPLSDEFGLLQCDPGGVWANVAHGIDSRVTGSCVARIGWRTSDLAFVANFNGHERTLSSALYFDEFGASRQSFAHTSVR